MKRRALLLSPLAALAVHRAGAAQPLVPTPADMEGPYYPPTRPAGEVTDLTRVPGVRGTAEGERLDLSGTVVGTDGAPIAGAIVEIWQADARRSYIHPSGASGAGRDPAFAGYGRVRTGTDGAYRFTTVRPPAYAVRPPHVHFRVSAPGRPPLVTQLYFDGQNQEQGWAAPFGRSRAEARALQTVPLERAADGGWTARFRIVLADA
jgi:protocatechuate 3,4-dioxygenase beta subunit